MLITFDILCFVQVINDIFSHNGGVKNKIVLRSLGKEAIPTKKCGREYIAYSIAQIKDNVSDAG